MKPVLLPLAERVGRFALRQRGVRSRHVVTPHGKVHVYDARGTGTLPPVVILHGIGSAATPFAPLFLRLLRDFSRVIVPDYPGHGFSEDPSSRFTPEALFESVTTTLEAVVDEPALFVGNSLGGGVALQYALRAATSGRVRGLVLLSPAGARSSEEEWAHIQRMFDMNTRADAQRFAGRLYHRVPWFFPLLAHELPSAFNRKAVRDLLATATNDDVPEPEALASLAVPVLLLWGKSERVLPDGHFDYLKRHLPTHAIIERPEGFGHCPHFDAPGPLARRIVQFARSIDGAVRPTH